MSGDLIAAVRLGQYDKVSRLFDEGADVNARSRDGQPLLLVAVQTGDAGDSRMVEMLLDRGANVEARRNRDGQTALMVAVRKGNPAIVKLLISRGASVECGSVFPGDGGSVLHFAIRNCGIDVIQAILSADPLAVNKEDKEGRTPLEMADKRAVAKYLLTCLPDVDSRSFAWDELSTILHASALEELAESVAGHLHSHAEAKQSLLAAICALESAQASNPMPAELPNCLSVILGVLNGTAVADEIARACATTPQNLVEQHLQAFAFGPAAAQRVSTRHYDCAKVQFCALPEAEEATAALQGGVPCDIITGIADGLKRLLSRIEAGVPRRQYIDGALSEDFSFPLKIPFATDRAVIPGYGPTQVRHSGGHPDHGMTSEALMRDVCLGVVTIEVPEACRYDRQAQLHRISEAVERGQPALHIRLIQDPREFLAIVDSLCPPEAGNAATVYIHGYNTTFMGSIKAAAVFAVNSKLKQPVVAYSWSSYGSILLYGRDRRRVQATRSRLDDFLQLLQWQSSADHMSAATKMRARKVSFVAHSMGNRAVIPPPYARVSAAIFAAPDVPSRYFKQAAEIFKQHGTSCTLYQANNDCALLVSSLLNLFNSLPPEPIAGNEGAVSPLPLISDSGHFDTVDCTGYVEGHFLGHSYISRDPAVARDAGAAIEGQLPCQRAMQGYLHLVRRPVNVCFLWIICCRIPRLRIVFYWMLRRD